MNEFPFEVMRMPGRWGFGRWVHIEWIDVHFKLLAKSGMGLGVGR